MIITQTVTINPSGKAIQYYKDKGYDAKWHQPLEVKVDDLPDNSQVIVEVKCDNENCNHIHTISYAKYTKNIRSNNGRYLCKDCHMERMQRVIFEKYGVTNISYLPEIQTQKEQTSMLKYGVPYPNMSPEFREHVLDIYETKYGERRLVISEDTIIARERTNLLRYGYKNPMQNSEVRERVYQTNQKKYNQRYVSNVPEVRQRATETMFKNQTVKTSRQQYVIYHFYSSILPQTKLNYPIGKKFSGDIVIDNIDYEVDYGGHNLSVKKGQLTQEEFDHNQMIRDKIVVSEGYKIIRLIAEKERKIPSDETLFDILNISKQYFQDYPNHSWIEWYIDDGYYCNAENKDGIPYDFGTLRKIKKADLPTEDHNDKTQAA